MNNIDQNKNSVLPDAFKALVCDALPSHADILIETIEQHQPSLSLRLNPAKMIDLQWPTQPVSWCQYGHYLSERPSFTLDPAFHAGAYYVQEASSMVLWSVLPQLKLPEFPVFLDLCAAPGGKSTLLLDFLSERGHLVANEVIKTRAGILVDNLVKWGHSNICVTNNDPVDFQQFPGHFDLMLVDAPCSGEGMFRKDPNAVGEWSMDNVSLCSARQQRIVDDIIPALKEGGYLIYSTCTFNQKENMDNVVQFAKKHNLISVPVSLDPNWNIIELSVNGLSGYQCIPGFTRGEGYFFSVFQKPVSDLNPEPKSNKFLKLRPLNKPEKSILENWISPGFITDLQIHENGDVYYFPPHLFSCLSHYLKNLHVKYAGIKLGKINKTIFSPEHGAALTHLPILKVPKNDLSKEDALRFLNKSLPTVSSPHQGWMVVTFQGLGLGWIKNLGNRINNYLPGHLRIQMDIGFK